MEIFVGYEKVFSEKFFEGKTFWEVENEVLWVDVCYWNERSRRETREELKRIKEERQKKEKEIINQ